MILVHGSFWIDPGYSEPIHFRKKKIISGIGFAPIENCSSAQDKGKSSSIKQTFKFPRPGATYGQKRTFGN
jgi:hypothetical protein